MLEGYLHALLKSILGTYVDLNEESEALRVSVWEGQVELRELRLKVDAFEPLLQGLPFSVAFGCIGYFKLQVPLINLGGQPIQVHVQDVYLLLRPRVASAPHSTASAMASATTQAAAKAYMLQAKRTTLQALELEQENEAKDTSASSSPAQSTFMSRLLTKLLDNIQVQIERIHIRLEDAVSDPRASYVLGLTLNELVVKSVDASGAYTLQVRDVDTATCLRKVLHVKKLAVYVANDYEAITHDDQVSRFVAQMQNRFWDDHGGGGYLIEPMTMRMSLLMNDRGVNVPLPPKAFSQRVRQRLGIAWLVMTRDAIGDDAWSAFVSSMPPRTYTLTFVFCEAWALAQDALDLDDIPTLEMLTASLRSCLQWPHVDALRESLRAFHAAAVRVVQENNTFLTVEVAVDRVAWRLHQTQYHSLLALLSAVALQRRQQPYKDLRPSVSVSAHPAAWWRFAIEAVRRDNKARLATVDWSHVHAKNGQKARYKELYLLLNDGSTGSSTAGNIHWGEVMREFDDLEYAMENADILGCRADAKKAIAAATKAPTPPPSANGAGDAPVSMWSYGYWFGTTTAPNPTPTSPTASVQSETQYLYHAINFDPTTDASMTAAAMASTVQYRVNVELSECSFQLVALLDLHVSGMALQLLQRAKSTDVSLELLTLVLTEVSDDASGRCCIARVPMETVVTLPEADAMSSVKLRHCEAPLPLLSAKVELPPLDDALADVRLTLVTQPVDARLNVPFVLATAAFFQPPATVDLHELDDAAWANAKSFTQYSAAQLRQAIAARTKLSLQVDVTSPIITIVETRSDVVLESPVRLTLYFGHLQARSHVQASLPSADHERSLEEFVARLPDEQLHDVIEVSVRGADVRLESDKPLLEQASIFCTLKTSVVPDDLTIPLIKLHGHVDQVRMHLSSISYARLQQLAASVQRNLAHVALPAPDMAPMAAAAVSAVASTRPSALPQAVSITDFTKLMQRIVVDGVFTVDVVDVRLYADAPLVRLHLGSMTSHVVLRSFDRRLEFGLGSLRVEDYARPLAPTMVSSSADAQSLIRVALTMASLDRPLPPEAVSSDVWAAVAYPQAWGAAPIALLQPALQYPVSVDVALDGVQVHVHRDTLSRLFLFFAGDKRDDACPIIPVADIVGPERMASLPPTPVVLERQVSAWANSLPPSQSSYVVRSGNDGDDDDDDSASYRTACAQTTLASPTYLATLRELVEPAVRDNTPWLQVQLLFKSFQLVLPTEDEDGTIVADVAVEGLYVFLTKSPTTLALAASLQTARIVDGGGREMVGADVAQSGASPIAPMHHAIHRQRAMVTLAYDAFGTEAFEEDWHPGYASGISLCLRSPRACFLTRFLVDLQAYATTGPLVETLAQLSPTSQDAGPAVLMGAANEELDVSAVSTFPSIQIELHDCVLDMPRDSSSHDAITLRLDALRVSNGPSMTDNDGHSTMDKVLRNARLTTLAIDAAGVRVVTTLRNRSTSLLGGTRFDLVVDMAHGTSVTICASPIRFVCSQEQYAFLLSAPTSNLNEVPERQRAPTSSSPQHATAAPPAASLSLVVSIPELSMELCNGDSGYQPTSTGDLSMATLASDDVASMARLHLRAIEASVVAGDSALKASLRVCEVVVSDSRRHDAVATPYRSLIALRHSEDEGDAFAITVARGNDPIPPLLGPVATPDDDAAWRVDVDLHGLSFYPSPLLQELSQFFVPFAPSPSPRAADGTETPVLTDDAPGKSQAIWPYPPMRLRLTCSAASVVLVENLARDDSRLLRLQWHASVTVSGDATSGVRVDVVLSQVQASSKLLELEGDGILKPISIRAGVTYAAQTLVGHLGVDQVIVLRCGYMDYTTLLAALAALAPPAQPPASASKTVPDATPLPQPLHAPSPPAPRRPVCYGDTRIKFVLFTPRGYFQSKDALGYYSGHWRKYMMMPPLPDGYETSFEEMTFTLLPAPSNDARIGDTIRFGDAVVIQDANGIFVAKYDALGASGYLGPEGGGGRFECRLWQAGTTIFNADRTAVHYSDSVELEGITLYDPNPAPVGPKEAAAQRTRATHGGYLMFNGLGDAPVVFALHSQDDDDDDTTAADGAENEVAHPIDGLSDRFRVVSAQIAVPGVRLTVLNDMNNMHLPLLHAEVVPISMALQTLRRRATLFLHLGMNLQAYNRRLAVWEPILEEFPVHAAYHAHGGVVCDVCLYEDSVLECPSTPQCAFPTAKTHLFTSIARRAFETKQQIQRDLLQCEASGAGDTLLLTMPSGLALNVSRNNLHVLFHGLELFTQDRAGDSGRPETFGSNVYVDNQSGVLLAYAMVDTVASDSTESGSRLLWTPVRSGSCVPTSMLAHEAPAGIVMAPMRRLLWLKYDKKPMLVPIEHGHKSCFQFQADQPLLGETVAEKGTLILRIRSAVQLRNLLGVPVDVHYDMPTGPPFLLSAGASTYVPVQALKDGYVTLCPRLDDGALDPGLPLAWRTLVAAAKKAPQEKAKMGHIVDTITFFWRAYPAQTTAGVHLPPYNVLVVASSVDLDLSLSLHAPLSVENLLPWPATYHLLHESKDGRQEIAMGAIDSGSCASMCVVDMRQDVSIALSLAVPSVGLPRSTDIVWIFGPKLATQRQYATLGANCVVVVDLCDPLQTSDRTPHRHGPVACRLYAEYWFIDRSGLGLHFDTPTTTIQSQRLLAPSPDEVFFAANPLTIASQTSVVCAKVLDGSAQWTSTAIDLSAIGTRAPLSLHRTHVGLKNVGTRLSKHFSSLMGIAEEKPEAGATTEFALGVRLDQGPGRFSRTTVVTLTPRYLLVNKSLDATLEVTQSGSRALTRLSPGDQAFFHWESDHDQKVQVRWLPLGGKRPTMWTHAFEMGVVGDFMLKMHAPPPTHDVFTDCGVHDHPTAHMLHVAIQLQDPMLVVVLHAAVEARPDVNLPIPYIVRNDCTRFRVVLWQKQYVSSHAYQSLDVLPPLTSLAYVPDVPRNNPTVCLQLQSTLLSSSPMKELELVPQDALVNIEVTFDKPHRLPVIQVGKRRVWVDMLMDGTTKSIVVTDMLPGTSEAHTHKRQSMLLKDWKHILRRLAQTAQVLAPVPSSVAWPETMQRDHYALCLYVLEARRLGCLLPTVGETFRPFVKIHLHGRSKEMHPQKQAISPIWLPQETEAVRGVLAASTTSVLRLEVRDADAIFGSTLLGYYELDVSVLCDATQPSTLDVWCPLTSSVTGMPSSASVHLLVALSPSAMVQMHEEVLIANVVRADVEMALGCRDRFQLVLEAASLDVADLESSTDGDRRSLTSFSTATSTASDDTLLDEKKQLSVVVMHVSSPLPLQSTHNYYVAIESDLSTRCTTPVLPKDDAVTPRRRETPVVLDFLGGHALGLDLVYADGHVHVHGVDCDGQSGLYYKDGRIRIGDRVQAVNSHTILNLSKDAAFAAIEAARSDAVVFTLTLAPTTTPDDAPVVDIEWNRRLLFGEAKADGYLKVRLYERPREKDHGVSEEKEASVLPFLYFFGEDAIMDDLDHSKQHRQTDTLLAICWVRIPDDDDDWVRVEHAHERICALYQFVPTATSGSELRIVGHIRIALKWELLKPLDAVAPSLSLYAQIDVGPVFVSLVDLNEEVLCASLTGSPDVPGIQVSYGVVSDNRQVINVRLDHVQLDNQLVDTNYPVTLAPVRPSGGEAMPTVQFMAVVNVLPAVMHFEYIFAQLQELEIKVEDFLLVAIARVFSNIDWSFQAPALAPRASSVYALLSAQNLLAELHITDSMLEENKKVVLRWLLLCPIRLNVTFSSTTDQPLTHSILSPQMSPLLRSIIGAATALVTNLDRAPIEIPEFYIESVFETKYALGFYVMQHYLHYGLRSWYKIVGSVDVLGNPIGLVSTLGTGVRDFFFTPAQMLLEDESGLRIENLRTGMTKGSKSLLRNTAVGIFHTTGKITETLGKGIAMLAMDNEYNTQRQQRALKQATTISHLGDGIVEGGKDLAGGIWEGVRGVVIEPVVGAANDGAGGFIVGLGKGFAGLLVKPTAGVLDLLTSVSHGVKVTAESMDARLERRGSSRVRLPRRFGSDGVLVAYSEREAKGSALMLLTGLEDEYVYHVEYGDEANRGLVLLTNKRITCLAKGHPLWELALDSTLVVEAVDHTLRVTAVKKLYSIPCHASPRLFQVAVEHLRSSSGLQETRYLLLNLEKKGRCTEVSTDVSVTKDPGAETVVLELSDLQSQPIRSIRVELCHIDNKDARAPYDVLASFSVYRLLVLGGPYQWTVFRRFSEFRELHETLQQLVDMSSLPRLPPRHLFFSTRASIVKGRQDALSVYLQAVIMHPPILHAAEMQHFLTHEASDVHVAHVGLP